MVFLRSFLTVLVFILFSGLPCLCDTTWVTKDGYYIDRRGDFENSQIYPPHPENIPVESSVVQPVVDYFSYYQVNVEGYRGREDKLPIVPGYTQSYSTRTAQLYNKEDYINVWCDGEKHVGKVDCLTEDSAISFFPLSAWTRGGNYSCVESS